MSGLIDTYSVEESIPNFENGRCLPKHGYFIRQTNKLYNSNNGLIFFNEEHDDYIFKLCYPVGSIFITKTLLKDLGATLIDNTNPENIRYSWHGCIFRYLHQPVFPDMNQNQQSYLAGGLVTQNPDGTYKERLSYYGGVNKNQFILNGSGYVQPHVLTINEMPSHNHSLQLSYGANDPYNGIQYGNTPVGWHNNTVGYTGGNQGHTHDFNATVKIQINPSYFGALFYERIR